MDNTSPSQVVFLRYWGSYFKFTRQVEAFVAEFKPLLRRGWRCVLVLEREPENSDWLRMLSEIGVAIEYMPRPKSNFDLRSIIGVFKLCHRLKPSILVCTNMHSNTLIGAALARVPIRIWCKEAMNSAFEECRPLNWRSRLVPSVRLSAFLASRIIAVSASVRDELVALGIASRRIVVCHVPRRLGNASSRTDRKTVRRQLGWSEETVVITTVGHAVPVKAWDVLVRAFARVALVVPEAKLVLIGSHAARHEKLFFEKLQAEIQRAGLAQSIVFLGQRKDVPDLLMASEMFVLPSRSEGCSYALIEALEANLPCVVTRVGAAEQVVTPGVNGFIVPRCDEQALADALLNLAGSPTLRQQFRSHAAVPPSIPTLEEYAENLARDFEGMLALPSHHRLAPAV